MTIELLTGEAAATAGTDREYSGMLSPRRFRVSESLSSRAVRLMSDAFDNKWGANVKLAEAFSTSDFTLAAFAETDKEMLAQYEELPSEWEKYTDTTTVRDFRPKRLQSRWRNNVGMPVVPELTEYPADDRRGAEEYAIGVAKHGRRFSLSWEAWINNEAVQELEDLPGELARQARETEVINAVANLLLVDPATGLAPSVNTAFFKAGNGNAPTALPLTRDNLKTVINGMATKRDPHTNRVIARPDVVVVIPKALEATMLSIVAATIIRTTTGGVETEQANDFANLDYVVEPLLDSINQHAKAATTWFVVPKPGGPRPALWAAKLKGHETPDIRVKTSNSQAVGGGEITPLDGSFEIDDLQYRGRHIVGRQTADALFTYVSLGS